MLLSKSIIYATTLKNLTFDLGLIVCEIKFLNIFLQCEICNNNTRMFILEADCFANLIMRLISIQGLSGLRLEISEILCFLFLPINGLALYS